MKCSVVIDKGREEEVQIFAHERSTLVEKIVSLAEADGFELVGKKDKTAYRLNMSEVVCFVSENNRVFAVMDRDRYEIDKRIYELEEICSDNFIKINQSCIANIYKIENFGTTISASLTVNFKNGYRDYVSRRQMKSVKERLMGK